MDQLLDAPWVHTLRFLLEVAATVAFALSGVIAAARKRLDVVVSTLSEIIKPALILLAGGLFIFMIVALLLPIYDLVRQSVNQSLGGGG